LGLTIPLKYTGPARQLLGRDRRSPPVELVTQQLGSNGEISLAIRDLLLRDLLIPEGSDPDPNINFVPVQFGFNEILVNRKGQLHPDLRAKANAEALQRGRAKDENKEYVRSPAWSYGDFEIGNLLRDGVTKIAIWHWYLPSLLHILLCWEATNDGGTTKLLAICEKLKHGNGESWKDFEEYLNGLCESLLEPKGGWRNRLKVYSTMDELQMALRTDAKDFPAGVVLGSGSSVLVDKKGSKSFDHVEAIVPRQGVFVWINCAAAINRYRPLEAGDLINYWLRAATQRLMFDDAVTYYGLPANEKALGCVRTERPEIRAVQTFDFLCASEGKFHKDTVAPRVLPPIRWGQWTNLWEKFQYAARGKRV
jgi:hypothetical protein